ncbi:hypothetical protein LRP12_29810, partial [Pseudomonas aeruginosa]|uniref:hypothetical protein n=1 Tax=Pseudomonas aeruginosa TaxID=287 RepID=UPI001F358DE9
KDENAPLIKRTKRLRGHINSGNAAHLETRIRIDWVTAKNSRMPENMFGHRLSVIFAIYC